MSSVELLAPAGSFESVLAAAHFGADAVYMGGPCFQMRSATVGFDAERIRESVEYLHRLSKKVYITVNTVLFEKDIPLMRDYVLLLRSLSPDGLIISDIGTVLTVKELWPEVTVILSMQANVMNSISAAQYFSMGVSRIVLAREMTLDDIRSLRDHTDPRLSLEAFVHGSMCMAYSGRCLLSSFLLGRSANEGKCAQPCRWEYRVEEKKRPGQFFDVEQNGDFSLIFSSRDLCMIDHLQELKEAGVSSFKIEGRMKTEYYTATVTNAYRMALDSLAPLGECIAELEKVSHRPYTTGFYYSVLPDDHYNDGQYVQDWSFCGRVLSCADGWVTVQQRNRFDVGDRIEILSPGKPGQQIAIKEMYGPDGEPILSAPHPMMEVRFPCDVVCEAGDMLRKKSADTE